MTNESRGIAVGVAESQDTRPDAELAAGELAKRYGLTQMGVRPPLMTYVRDVWRWRTFAQVLGRSKAFGQNQQTYLGQLWTLLTPTLNAIVYVLIFGILLKTGRGLDNTIGFIVVGNFIYGFFSGCVTGGARSVGKNMGLVRSLHFPRAVLPISSAISKLTSLMPTLLVMMLFVILSQFVGARPTVEVTWRWLLLIPAVALVYIFSTGVGFFMARLTAFVPDLLNVLGFVLRLTMYASGVLFPVSHYIHNETLVGIVKYQPVAIYLELPRQALLNESTIPLDWTSWLWGVGWAGVTFIVGFFFFWRAEARYGRE